jgi:hypothetical protein
VATPTAIERPVPAVPARHTLPGQLIVSLTSHPPRFPMLRQALDSLLGQDMRPDAVVLWLARHEFASLPSDILRLDGLTIRQCEDLRSYKKLIPALEAYPGAFVLTADDDLVYPRTWVRDFVQAYRGQNEVICRRKREVSLDPSGKALTPYNTWPIIQDEAKGDWVFPTSCHGMLVVPGSLSPKVADMKQAQRLCPMNDDIWWWWWAYPNLVRSIVGSDPIRDLPTGKDGLWSQHNRDGGNDRQIAAMIDAYGLPWAQAIVQAEAAE